MNSGVDFKNKNELLKIITYVFCITFVSIMGNIFYNDVKKNINSKNIKIYVDTREEVEMVKDNDCEITEKVEFKKTLDDENNAEQQGSDLKDDVQAYRKQKIAYLTFDDGPSANITPKILDELKNKDVKATFFVVGSNVKEYPNIVQREKNEGHGIGNHSYTHDYKYIYQSPENLMKEIKDTEDILKEVLGESFNKKIFRFPGGSFNISKRFKDELKNDKYEFYDWNCLNGDAEGVRSSKTKLIENVKSTSKGKNKLIILMHDAETKETTYEALGEIIDYLKAQGYTFDLL